MAQRAPAGLTRAEFLKRLGGAAGVAALGGAAYGAVRLADGGGSGPSPAAVQLYRSLPDLRLPGIAVTGEGRFSDYLMLSPSIKSGSHVKAEPGAMIVDASGHPVWFHPVDHTITDFKVTRYAGQPVLCWWQGRINGNGYGQGEAVIVDASYRRLATIRAGHGRQADLHELQITPQGTALITCFPRIVDLDLRSVGGPSRGQVLENVIQEVDVRSGRVLMEWRSLDHIAITESYHPFRPPFDYLHANSIDITPDGHLLISCRNTWALYKVHRRTGEIIWRLGGKKSDFSLDHDARFTWQHDARQLSADTITLFDDGSDGPTRSESQSRGLALRVDTAARRVRVEHQYEPPHSGLLASSMGNLQTLPAGRVLVGWGIAPYTTEFEQSGKAVANLRMATGFYSYRSYQYPWTGRPTEPPALAVSHGTSTGQSSRAPVAHVSWNGATEVTHWQLHTGRRRGALRAGPIVPHRGFETRIALPQSDGIVRAAALDRSGRQLGISPAVTV